MNPTQIKVDATPFSVNWIVDQKNDLLWFMGACVSGYLLIYLNLGLGISVMLLWWFWIVSMDGPHVFGTLSRTYLDKQEWAIRSPLLWGSLLWFLLGPLAVGGGILFQTKQPFFIFLTFAQLWAYWHVVRQHYGFMVIYQKKNGEAAGKANPVDYWIFYILMLIPFVSFLLRHPEARPQLGLGLELSALELQITDLINIIVIGAILVYIFKEFQGYRQGRALNLPKSLFLLSCVPLHLVIFMHPVVSTQVDIRLFAVFVTFYHNIQYHGIIWFYNRNRYGRDKGGEQFGLASKVSRNFFTYYLVGILFSIAYRYSDWFFSGLVVPFAAGPNPVSTFALGGLFTVSDLAIGFWWGFAFNHYFLDQYIWRLSKDKQVNVDLKLA
ncbi:MAG: hypothetical protein U9N31_10825 [Candidatus Marinimicrobia bacterium]|nr:hypothetical protein [Candidatus Neomarinimicrobiota bacterium]